MWPQKVQKRMIEFNNESAYEVSESRLLELARFAFKQLYLHPDTELGVTLVDEPAMEQLHIQWMNEPGPTDVLSFPMDELRPGRPEQQTGPGMLGDIVICPQVAQRQAAAAGHSLLAEMQVLLTHGILHVLGYDHATPLEEAEMFGLQRQIIAKFEAQAGE